jgi:hypothetical protein
MNKLIIDNRTDLSDYDAVKLTQMVIQEGRISGDNDQYTYVSVITHKNVDYKVITDLNPKSDRFIIKYNDHDT